MMVCTNIDKFVNEKDANDDRIGDWCQQVGKGLFTCKWCVPRKELSFKQGKVEVLKHARRDKHKESRPSPDHFLQATLPDIFNNERDEAKVKADNLAVALTSLLKCVCVCVRACVRACVCDQLRNCR